MLSLLFWNFLPQLILSQYDLNHITLQLPLDRIKTVYQDRRTRKGMIELHGRGVSMVNEKGIDSSNVLIGQVHKLIDLVDYQEGSIVSKTIIDQDTGTLTLFAFDQGQGLSEHTVPFDALVHILDGEAEVIISGESMHPEEGDVVLMPANKPHALKAVKKFKMLLVMIKR